LRPATSSKAGTPAVRCPPSHSRIRSAVIPLTRARATDFCVICQPVAVRSAMQARRICEILWPLLVDRLPSSSVVHVRSGLSSWSRIVQPANSLAAILTVIEGSRNTLSFNAWLRVWVSAGPKAKATFARITSDSRLTAHSDSTRLTFAGSLAAFDQSKRDQRDHDGIRRPDSLAGEPECKHAVVPRGILLLFSSHLEFRIPGEVIAVEVDRILLRCPPEVPQKGLQVEPAIGRVRHPAQRPREQ